MIFNIGINDMPKPATRKLPYYQIWQDMIRRCYDPKSQSKTLLMKGAKSAMTG